MKTRNIVYLLLFSVVMMSFGLCVESDNWELNVPTTSFDSYNSMKFIQNLVIEMTNKTAITNDDFRIEVKDPSDNLVFGKDYINTYNFDLTFLLESSSQAGTYKLRVIDSNNDVLISDKDIQVTFSNIEKTVSIDEKITYSTDVTKTIALNSVLETERANFNDIASTTLSLFQITDLEGAFIDSSFSGNNINFVNDKFTKNGNSEYEVEYEMTYEGKTVSFIKKVILSVTQKDAMPYLNEASVSLSTLEDTPITVAINSSLDDNNDVVGWFFDDDQVSSLSYVFDGTECTGAVSGTNFVFTPSSDFNGNCEVDVTIKDKDYLSNSIDMRFNINVEAVDDIPVLSVDKTLYQFYKGGFENILMTIEDPDSTTFSYKVNGADQPELTGNTITLTEELVGESTSVEVVVYHNSTKSVSKTVTIQWVTEPTIDSFTVEGDFSNPSSADLKITNTDFVIDWISKINLKDSSVDLSSLVDYEEKTSGADKDVLIHVLSGSILDTQANISLSGFTSKPIVSCATGKVTEKKYLREDCSGLTVNYDNGNVWFIVNHFSTYRIVSSGLLNSLPELNETSTIKIAEDDSTYQLKYIDEDGDLVTFTPISLPDDVSLSSNGLLTNLDELSLGSSYSFKVNLSDGYDIVTETFTLKRTVEAKLKITDLDIDADDSDDEDNLEDGDSFSVKPGESFTLQLELSNEYSNSDDVDISGTVYVELINIDDGDDVEYEEDFEIEANDEEDVEFEIQTPIFVDEDEDSYQVLITVEYEDDDDNSFEDLELELELEIDRDSTDLIFSSLNINPSVVICEDRFTISGQVVNIGTKDRDIIVQLKSSDLGIETNFDLVEVEKYGDDDTYSFSKTYEIKNLEEDRYLITGKIYYDNSVEYISAIYLTKKTCSSSTPVDSEDSDEGNTIENDTEYQIVQPIITDGSIDDNSNSNSGISTTLLLVVVMLLLLSVVVIVFLLPAKK